MTMANARLDALTLRLDSLRVGLLTRAGQLETQADQADTMAGQLLEGTVSVEAFGTMTGAIGRAVTLRVIANEFRIIAEAME